MFHLLHRKRFPPGLFLYIFFLFSSFELGGAFTHFPFDQRDVGHIDNGTGMRFGSSASLYSVCRGFKSTLPDDYFWVSFHHFYWASICKETEAEAKIGLNLKPPLKTITNFSWIKSVKLSVGRFSYQTMVELTLEKASMVSIVKQWFSTCFSGGSSCIKTF